MKEKREKRKERKHKPFKKKRNEKCISLNLSINQSINQSSFNLKGFETAGLFGSNSNDDIIVLCSIMFTLLA
jgi:hypothetical protein